MLPQTKACDYKGYAVQSKRTARHTNSRRALIFQAPGVKSKEHRDSLRILCTSRSGRIVLRDSVLIVGFLTGNKLLLEMRTFSGG